HPMACAVALKNIEIIESECLIENTKRIGKELLDGLKLLQKNHVVIGEVRGKGLMGAIEFDHTVTASPIAPLIVNEAVKRGLICRSVVFDGQDTLVMAPPLIITKEELYHILDILDDCIHAVKETM
ncbi:aspartate aminotransferase family protein, partial [Bacillus sp. UMB0899]